MNQILIFAFLFLTYQKRYPSEREMKGHTMFAALSTVCRIQLSYLPTPLLWQDMTQGQFFKRSLTGLNSEYSFF